jgi:hypothetical protein
VRVGPYAYNPEADELEDSQERIEKAHLDFELTSMEAKEDHTRDDGILRKEDPRGRK